MDVQTIPLHLLDPDPDQPRRHVDELEDKQLALSLRERKLLQPLIVFRMGERYRIVDGHRRWKGLRMVQAQEAAAIVLPAPPAADTLLELQLTANCLRSDMTPLDKAHAYQRLLESRGWNHSELAAHLHIAKGTVTQCLSYLKLSTAAQTALQRGELAESTAYAIARAPDSETKQRLLESARKGELRRDDAQAAVRQRSSKRSSTSVPTRRLVCQLSELTVTVSSQQELSLAELQDVWHRLWKECKRAASKHWDVPTLQRVLANEHRPPVSPIVEEG